VSFDRDIINALLETPTPRVCRIEAIREELPNITSLENMETLEEIKKEHCGEGIPWLKQIEGYFPTKFSLKYMKPIERAWGTFVVYTLESYGNSFEFHLVSAVAIQEIMNGVEINMGRIIVEHLRKIDNESKKSFTYEH